jgi:division protein CdvB (Snf7/Vps24/ESCRT-III family)
MSDKGKEEMDPSDVGLDFDLCPGLVEIDDFTDWDDAEMIEVPNPVSNPVSNPKPKQDAEDADPTGEVRLFEDLEEIKSALNTVVDDVGEINSKVIDRLDRLEEMLQSILDHLNL